VKGHRKVVALLAEEFLRRWLQHVLPSGFVKIRHAGLLSNRKRTERLALCRLLLALAGMLLPVAKCLGEAEGRGPARVVGPVMASGGRSVSGEILLAGPARFSATAFYALCTP
jgi:hypothetical protein